MGEFGINCAVTGFLDESFLYLILYVNLLPLICWTGAEIDCENFIKLYCTTVRRFDSSTVNKFFSRNVMLNCKKLCFDLLINNYLSLMNLLMLTINYVNSVLDR